MASYNWGTGLGGAASGAASGAAIGSMIPGVGTAIGGVVGGLGGLLGGFQSGGGTEQVNPFAQSYWDMASGNMENYQRQMGTALGQQQGYLGQQANTLGQLQNFEATAQYDPGAAMRMTRAQVPQFQQLAKASMEPFGMSADETSRRMTSAAQSTAAEFNQMGGLGSGAAQGAIGEAAANVQGNIDMQQQQMYQQAFMNQMQQAAQMNQTGLQQQFQGQQQADQLRFQGIGAAAQGYGQIAEQYGQQGQMFGQLAGQSQASMAGMAGPEFIYEAPQQTFGDIAGGLNSAASIAMLGQEAGIWGGGGQQQQPTNFQGPVAPDTRTASPFEYQMQNQNFQNPYDNPFMTEANMYPRLFNQSAMNDATPIPTMTAQEAGNYRRLNPNYGIY